MAYALPFFVSRLTDANGDVLAGGKFHVFLATTTTPTDCYTTSALSVAHANPLIADSGGLFAKSFFAAGDYKIRYTTAADVTVLEIDNFHVEQEGTEIDFPTEVKTANFTVTANDRGKVFLVDASGGNITVSADSETLGSGFPFFIADRGASGTTTIAGTGVQTVDGAASVSISNQYSSIGFVSVGAAGWQSIATSDLSAFALLASTNVFTANQSILSTDVGATNGPGLTLRRVSSSPAASDLIGFYEFSGMDSGGNELTYVKIATAILDPTNGSEDGQLAFQAMIAGALTEVLVIGNGIATPGATGGFKGPNTINASAFYDDNVQLVPPTTLLGTITTTSGTSQSLGSLVLTSYKFLKLVINGVSTNTGHTLSAGNSTSDDVAIAAAAGAAGASQVGIVEIELSTGIGSSAISDGTTSAATGFDSAITNATTTLTISTIAGNTFDAGSILVYGIG